MKAIRFGSVKFDRSFAELERNPRPIGPMGLDSLETVAKNHQLEQEGGTHCLRNQADRALISEVQPPSGAGKEEPTL
jgi:hypothetical protein